MIDPAKYWNDNYPVGTRVILTDELGKQHETKTRTPAWTLMSGGTIVFVDGRAESYDITNLRLVLNEHEVEVIS